MIEIIWEESFVKKLKKLIKSEPAYKNRILEKIKLFGNNPFEQTLKTHKLNGKLKDYWAFSIDYSYRIVFRFGGENLIYFISIGTHEEVY